MRTFTIIKPDAVRAGHTGAILAALEADGFEIVGMRMTRMTEREAQGFYAEHRARPFFASLVKFMSSGPSVLAVLQREDAVSRLRTLMGPTDPKDAAPGTLRAQFATSVEQNAIHGSDSPNSAAIEIAYFFASVAFAAGS